MDEQEIAKSSGLGYNPATKAIFITPEQGEKVRSSQFKEEYALGDTVKKLQPRL